MAGSGKIVIIGAGHVGSHCAQALAWEGSASDIVLVDRLSDKAQAQALDISDALCAALKPAGVRAGDYAEAADADIVVIAIGEAWRPGQTRLDLFDASIRMLGELCAVLRPLDLQGLVVTITNPADVVADFVRRSLGLSRFRCFGTGTLLDTARLVRLLSEGTGLPRASVSGLVMGEHGDSSVSVFSQVRLDGRPFDAFPGLDKAALTVGTRQAGMTVLAGKGFTEFGIGQATAGLCSVLLSGRSAVFPLTAALEGEYGQTGIHAGVPCRVGRNGIEEIVEVDLDSDERAAFEASCGVIRAYVGRAQAQA